MKSEPAISLAAPGLIAPKRFWMENSLLNPTRLNRFIFFSFIAHMVFVLLYLLTPNRSDVKAPPPIQVKFINNKKKGTIIDAPEPKSIEKPKTSELLASKNSRAHSKAKKTPDKQYRRKKTVISKSSGGLKVAKKSPSPPKKKAGRATARKKTAAGKQSFPVTDRGTLTPGAKKKQKKTRGETAAREEKTVIPKSAESLKVAKKSPSPPKKKAERAAARMSSKFRGTLSLLDGFDPNKYALKDTKTEDIEETDDGEDVSLDTTEIKYSAYFSRITHQIKRVWIYPRKTSQKGINGRLTLKFGISRDGNLLSVRVVEGSGHEILDIAALKAVKEAAPFYPFPINIKKERLSILATFIYTPTYESLKK